MTRDYNKQPRDDTRSSPRGQSPNRTGEEQAPRPPRPRLNRATVDRAWKSGAPTQHADYRTRSSNGQPSRNGWRNNQPSEHSSAQYGRNPYRPYGNQQGNQRSLERTQNGNFGSRPRSFEADRERYDNQRTGGNDRPGNPGGFQKNGAYHGSRDNQQRHPQDQRPPFHDNERNRGYQGRGYENHDHYGHRDFKRDERSPRDFERGERTPRNYAEGNRPFYPAGQRDNQNPRWQSRPAARLDNSSRERPGVKGPEGELFEGDYERFDTPVSQRNVKPGRPYKGSNKVGKTRVEPEEQHVTRLPDGRVLKGPRPQQRKEAQFWTGIATETEGLIKQIETPGEPELSESSTTSPEDKMTGEDAVQSSPAEGKKEPKAPRKARSHAASTIASTKKEKKKAAKPRSSGTKPSQRGYKWPAPQQ